MQSDHDIIKLIQKGDTEQYRHIIRRYQDQVAATIAGMIGTEEGFEDIGQEVFIRFFKSLNSFKFQSSVGTYLTRIAINLTINEIKRKQRFRQRYVPLDEKRVSKEIEEDLTFSDEMLHHLNKLPGDYRSTVTLRFLHGYDTSGGAEVMEITEGAFRTRLSRALSMLRESMKKERTR